MFFRLSLITILTLLGLACEGTEAESVAESDVWEARPIPLALKQQYKSVVEVNPDDPATEELREACMDSCVIHEVPSKLTTVTTPMGEVPTYTDYHQVISDCCSIIARDGHYYHVVHQDRIVDY